jgi:hypothetical protein
MGTAGDDMRTRSRISRVAIVVGLAASGAPVVLELPVHEFVVLQRLPDAELRNRFQFPDWCDPTVGATGSTRTRITVIIDCTARGSAGPDEATAPPEPRRSVGDHVKARGVPPYP